MVSTAARYAAWKKKTGGIGVPAASTFGSGTPPEGTPAFTVEIYVDGGWLDITSFVRFDTAINIKRGRSSEGSDVAEPSQCDLTIDNRDGRFSPRNQNSPLYGKIGRNTPLRVTKGGQVRFHGEVAAWPQRWDSTGSDVYVPIVANGVLRRLGQGSAPTRTPIYRDIRDTVNYTAPDNYWPCESTFAQRFGPTYGTNYINFSGNRPQFAQNTDHPASAALADINGGTWTGRLAGTSGSWAFSFLLSAPGGITANSGIAQIWIPQVDSAELYYVFYLTYTSTDTVTVGISTNVAGGPGTSGTLSLSNGPAAVQITYDGTDLKCWAQYQGQSTMTLIATQGGVGTQPAPTHFVMNADEYAGSMTDVYLGHFAFWSGTTYTTAARSFPSLSAYWGEDPVTRFARLATEEEIGFRVTGGGDPSGVLMGYQEQKTILDTFREIEDTDFGFMNEARDLNGLSFRGRQSIYNQAVAMDLDYSANHLSGELQPVDDDTHIRNVVNVQRTGGGSNFLQDTTSSLSSRQPPRGVGKYDENFDLSLSSNWHTHQAAGWLLHMGTVDEARYTQIAVALENPRFVADPVLTEKALMVDVGDRITISNLPSWMPVGTADQIILGYEETFDQYQHSILYNTAPYSPYEVAVYDTDRYDSGYSTLANEVDGSEVSWSVSISKGPLWTTDVAEFPFDMWCDGEQVTVTAIAGASSPQTFTVTRSINGVTRAHAPGSNVSLYAPPIRAL